MNHPNTLLNGQTNLQTPQSQNKKMKLSVDNLDNNIFLNGKEPEKNFNEENVVNISKVKVK